MVNCHRDVPRSCEIKSGVAAGEPFLKFPISNLHERSARAHLGRNIMKRRTTVILTGMALASLALASITRTSAQAQAPLPRVPSPVLKTAWGEPDLQGIWTVDTET